MGNKMGMIRTLAITCCGAALAIGTVASAQGAEGANAHFYAVSNKADGNTIVEYERRADGSFTVGGEYATGGTGTGNLEVPALSRDVTHPLANGDDPLISAHGLARSADGKYLVAVNPGDATVSLMAVARDGSLKKVDMAAASDRFPVSVGVHGDLVVVASIGTDNMKGSIALYRISGTGLNLIKGTRRDLQARPSTIGFSSDGEHVIVDELVTGKIKVFAVEANGLSQGPTAVIDSPRQPAETRFHAIPVDFDIRPMANGDDILIVSEARFLTPDFKLREDNGQTVQVPRYSWQTSSLSTYRLSDDGKKLSLISGDVLTGNAVEGGEIANCWIALSADGKVLYAINALSSSISSFDIAPDGSARLRKLIEYKDASEKTFLSDVAVSADGKQLYQLVGNKGTVLVFDIGRDYGLTYSHTVEGGLPEIGSFGMIAM